MKKIISNMTLILSIAVLIFTLLEYKTSKAATNAFQNVIPFVNNMGYIGFFDQNTGKIYLYDGDLKKCVMTTQLSQLGEPTSEIKSFIPPQKESIKYYVE